VWWHHRLGLFNLQLYRSSHKEKMIEASQRMIEEQNNSRPVNEHFKLQIKTLRQNAPRDEDKLEQLLKIKERQKDEAMHT